MDRYRLIARWGPRAESVVDAADRLQRCLVGLSSLSSAFATWFEQKGSMLAKHSEVSLTSESLQRQLERGRHRDEPGTPAMEDLGFHIGLWNGQALPSSFGLAIGGWSPHLWNDFVLRLPRVRADRQPIDPEEGWGLMQVVVDAFDPDWATLVSSAVMDGQDVNDSPIVGWLTYVKWAVESPANVVSRPIGNGTALQASPDVGRLAFDDIETVRAVLNQNRP